MSGTWCSTAGSKESGTVTAAAPCPSASRTTTSGRSASRNTTTRGSASRPAAPWSSGSCTTPPSAFVSRTTTLCPCVSPVDRRPVSRSAQTGAVTSTNSSSVSGTACSARPRGRVVAITRSWRPARSSSSSGSVSPVATRSRTPSATSGARAGSTLVHRSSAGPARWTGSARVPEGGVGPATAASSSRGAAIRAASSSATGVGVTPRGSRSNSSRPVCRSSARICVVTVGCDSPSSRAAPVKEPERYTARKVRSRFRSREAREAVSTRPSMAAAYSPAAIGNPMSAIRSFIGCLWVVSPTFFLAGPSRRIRGPSRLRTQAFWRGNPCRRSCS